MPHTLQRSRFFFFNDTATTEIYTLSLHDALPIWDTRTLSSPNRSSTCPLAGRTVISGSIRPDRKSTRLNSSHGYISYAVFCLKKKKTQKAGLISLPEIDENDAICQRIETT